MRFHTRLLASVSLAVLLAHPAPAATAGAAQALQILTRARVADDRCQFLSPTQHDELNRYSARAELAAAQQMSPSVASAAIAAGKSEGAAATCNDATRSDVADTLAAARQAVKRADAAGSQPAQPQADNAPPSMPAAMPIGRPGSLARYARLIGPYYLERKCRVLSPNQDNRYWHAITQAHQATVAANGYPAVRELMHRAEVSAASRDCGASSLLTIKAGFAAALNR